MNPARIRLSAALLAVLLAGTHLSLVAQDGGLQKLELSSYLDMESVSDPRISPDGSQIIYTRGWIDPVNDRRKSSLWIMDADGSRNRFLAEGGGARWSPDGSRILFTREGEPKGSQIFVRWMDAEGAITQVTRLENGPSNARWSPDSRWIAFTSRVDIEADFAGVKMPSRPKGASWTGEEDKQASENGV